MPTSQHADANAVIGPQHARRRQSTQHRRARSGKGGVFQKFSPRNFGSLLHDLGLPLNLAMVCCHHARCRGVFRFPARS